MAEEAIDAALVEDEIVETPVEVETDTEVSTTDLQSTSDAETDEQQQVADEQDSPESSTGKKDDSFQERINEVTGKYHYQQRLAESAQQQVSALEQRLAQLEQKPAAPQKSLADFDYDESAFQQHLTDQAVAQARQEVETAQQADAHRRQAMEFAGREAEFAKDVEDYTRLTQNQELPDNDHMAEVIQRRSEGPALFYHLAQNPDIAGKLADMNPYDAIFEMGMAAASKLAKPEMKKVTDAPKPAEKLKTVDAKPEKSPSDMGMSDFEKWRRKHIAKR